MHHTYTENYWMATPPGFEPDLLVPKANRISTTPRGQNSDNDTNRYTVL